MELQFHYDPTVSKSEIIVLLGQVWVYARKEKAQCERHFFYHIHYLKNPNGGCVRKYVSNLVFKFHDNPMVNEFEIVVLLRQV